MDWKKGVLEWVDVPTPGNVEEILATYDRHHDELTRRLHALPAAQWERRVPFMFEGKEIMNETGYENAWGFLLDAIHHRGQLSTYLRPMGSTVPVHLRPERRRVVVVRSCGARTISCDPIDVASSRSGNRGHERSSRMGHLRLRREGVY